MLRQCLPQVRRRPLITHSYQTRKLKNHRLQTLWPRPSGYYGSFFSPRGKC